MKTLHDGLSIINVRLAGIPTVVHSFDGRTRDGDVTVEAPVILVGDGQVEFFSSCQSLVADVEPSDASLFVAYDSRGRPLRLTGEARERRILGIRVLDQSAPVHFVLESEAPTHADELRSALLDWWVRTGGTTRETPDADAEAWSLGRLVAAIAERDGVQ